MDRQQIGHRLLEARKQSGLSRADVTAYAKIGATTLQQWETGTREASIEVLGKLATLYQTTPQYLIFGIDSEQANPVAIQAQSNNDEYAFIPAYDIEASAGPGLFNDGKTRADKHLAFRHSRLQSRGLHAKDLAVLFTKGDSMVPTIPEGAAIVIDKSRTRALDGKIYVIRIDDRLFIKRTQWIPTGGLRLISDNPLYEAFDISRDTWDADTFQICGQVVHASYDLPI